MIAVTYDHVFNYLYGVDNRQFPGLIIRVENPHDSERAIEVDAHLDSGAERSLFNGWIANTIGLELLSGPELKYKATNDTTVEGRVHRVILSHPLLGHFPIEVGFSTGPIRRNLLGRDFFVLIQIGFREWHSTFYVTASP